MNRRLRNTLIWLVSLTIWVGICAAPSWVMKAFAVLVGLAVLPVLPYLFQAKRKTRSA